MHICDGQQSPCIHTYGTYLEGPSTLHILNSKVIFDGQQFDKRYYPKISNTEYALKK